MADADQHADDVKIEIDTLMSSMNRALSDVLPWAPNRCIFRIPVRTFELNEKAFIPIAFSIGPFHHNDPKLKPAERIKLKYLQDLLSRSEDPERTLKDMVQAIWSMEPEARACYAEPIPFDPNEFVQMLVLDCCFLIELFRKNARVVERKRDDPVFTAFHLRYSLKHDLILLENQVPWLVLEHLFKLTNDGDHDMPLVELALKYFKNLFEYPRKTKQMLFANKGCKHILDLLRIWLVLPIENNKEYKSGAWQPLPSTTSLTEAGIKFKQPESLDSVLEVKFKNGVLEIPTLLVDEVTETAFRNLISLEQCLPNCKSIFTSYAIFWDGLINTTADIEILGKRGAINLALDPKETKNLFNTLYYHTFTTDFYYSDISKAMDDYCKRRWPRWRAAYIHNYFSKPWAIFSQIVAVILLVLTFLQTLDAIMKK